MLFFVISGFCIQATSRKYDFSRLDDLAHYGLRRAARIIPLYLIAIIFTFAVGAAMGQTADKSFSFYTLAGNLLFLQTPDGTRGNWFVPFGGNAPLWSLSFEVFYYVIFPATVLLERRLPGSAGPRRSLHGLCLTFALCCISLLLYQILPNPIALFTALYVVWRIGVSIDDVRAKQVHRGELLVVLMALAFLIGMGILLRDSATLQLMLSGTILGIVWLVLYGNELSWVMRLRPINATIEFLAWIGAASYSLYLLHYPILQLTKYLLADTTMAIVASVGASLAAAVVAERLAGWIKRQLLVVRMKSA
jgi:peptidoglycan/LPS O-acetylase OafA/YrhL